MLGILIFVYTNRSLQLLLETGWDWGGLLGVETPLWPFCEPFRHPNLHDLRGPNPRRVEASDNVAAVVCLQSDRIFGVVGDEIPADCFYLVIIGIGLD